MSQQAEATHIVKSTIYRLITVAMVLWATIYMFVK